MNSQLRGDPNVIYANTKPNNVYFNQPMTNIGISKKKIKLVFIHLKI